MKMIKRLVIVNAGCSSHLRQANECKVLSKVILQSLAWNKRNCSQKLEDISPLNGLPG